MLITLWLSPLSENIPLLFFILALTVSAWYGGLGPGLVATALSAPLVSYWIIHPQYNLIPNDTADLIWLSLFLLIGATISFLGESRMRLNKSLLTSARLQGAVVALSGRALSGAALSDLMEEAVSLVAGALGVEYSKILEIQAGGDKLLLRAGIGWKAGLVGHATVEAGPNSQAGDTLVSREPVVVPDLRQETRFSAPSLLVEHSVVSGISVVIGEPGSPFGVLGAYSSRRRIFTRDDIQFLGSIAMALASALEKEQAGRVLEESERRFRTSFEQVAVGIAHVAIDGRWLYVNQKLCDIVGYSKEELLNLTFQDIAHPDDLSADLILAGRVLSDEINMQSIEKRHSRKDGSMVWINLTVSLSRSDAGEAEYYISVIEDVTQRKLAEDRLRQSEEKFRNLFEWAFEAIIIADGEGRIVSVNSKAEEKFGYDRTELLGQPVDILLPERVRNVHVEHRARYVSDPHSRPMGIGLELYGLRKDGSEFPIEISLSYVRTGDGILVMSFITDITQRKLAEEKLREQATLLDQAQEAIMVRDMQERIVYWNKGAERLYGWRADEVLGMNADAFLWKEVSERMEEAKSTVIKRNEWQGEIDKVTKDGRNLIVESHWSLVRDDQRQPRAKLVVDIDITSRKRLEASLAHAARFALLGELAVGLAHEIKNPLAGIKGMIDILIRRRVEDDPERADLEDMRHEVERIDQTVRALLNRARPRAINLAPFSLTRIVERAVNLARRQAAARAAQGQRIKVEFDTLPDPLIVPLDASQIEDALLNVISNAVDAIEAGEGRVIVRLRLTGPEDGGSPSGEAIIEVEDDGRGIAESDLERIFEPFFSTKPEGSGIGLATVRRIMRAHGGQIEVRSDLGRGSVFTLRLPAASDAARSQHT